jgi:hypothetical protein
MRFNLPAVRPAYIRSATLVSIAVMTCVCAWANPPPASGSSSAGPDSAVWVPKEFTFTYQGFTALYSCDGLRDKMRRVLLELGARPDLEVSNYGCTSLSGPDRFPGVRVRMNVLQPAGTQSEPAVAAHWEKVDLLARRDPIDATADCELIGQIKQQILPLFATRDVDYSSICQKRQLVPGGTRLTAEVLVPEHIAESAAR